MASELSPMDRLHRLNGRHFSIEEASEATTVHPSTIMNYLKINRLDVCSEEPGRGRARRFCLIDLYMLALMRSLVRLTGNAKRTAEEINRLVFSVEGTHEPATVESRSELKDAFCEDVRSAPHFLWYRPLVAVPETHNGGDYILLWHDLDAGLSLWNYNPNSPDARRKEMDNPFFVDQVAVVGRSYFNVTMRLMNVDRNLLKLLNDRGLAQ